IGTRTFLIAVCVAAATATTQAGITNQTEAAAVGGPDNYYTAEGTPILTPPRGMTGNPMVKPTQQSDGTVVYPADGIRVVGDISAADFQMVQRAIQNAIFADDVDDVSRRSLRYQKLHVIQVLSSTQVRVMTVAPPKSGDCQNGDNLTLVKRSGKWQIIQVGMWIS
ncbi:MAG: hypothetical protein WCH84_06340, partial [Verrucomicrobiota bacterium]